MGEAVLIKVILRLHAGDPATIRRLQRAVPSFDAATSHRLRLVRYACARRVSDTALCAALATEAEEAGQPEDVVERRAFHALLEAHQIGVDIEADRNLELLEAVRFDVPPNTVSIPTGVASSAPEIVRLWGGAPARGTARRPNDGAASIAEYLVDRVGSRVHGWGVSWRTAALASTALYLVGAGVLAAGQAVSIAGVSVALAASLDVWDGWLAQQSDRYATALYLDAVLDRAGEATIALGYYYYVTSEYGFGGAVPLVFAATAFYVPFSRAQADAYDLRTEPELFDRGVRWLILSGGMLISRPLYALALVTSLGIHTSLRRTIAVALPFERNHVGLVDARSEIW